MFTLKKKNPTRYNLSLCIFTYLMSQVFWYMHKKTTAPPPYGKRSCLEVEVTELANPYYSDDHLSSASWDFSKSQVSKVFPPKYPNTPARHVGQEQSPEPGLGLSLLMKLPVYTPKRCSKQ